VKDWAEAYAFDGASSVVKRQSMVEAMAVRVVVLAAPSHAIVTQPPGRR
jgi:hypothetical protein